MSEPSAPRRKPRHRLLLGFENRTRLLLAEDDYEMRALLTEVLSENGYEVIEATDGVDLAMLLRIDTAGAPEMKIDAVITDVRMPGLTGLEILEAVREVDWSTPIVLITAFPDDETVAESVRLGAAALFAKPFVLSEFVDTIRNLVPVRLS